MWLIRVEIYYHFITFNDINRVIHNKNAILVIKGAIVMVQRLNI